MEDAPWNVHSLTGSERHLLIAQAHLALALQNQVDFFLILVVPRHLSAVRFKRDVAQRKGFRLNRTRASHQVLSAPPGRISSSSDLGKIRDDHAQSTGPMRHGTNSLCPRRSLEVFSPEATRSSRSNISRPTSTIVPSPSAMRPALMSMLSRIRR